MTGSSETRMEKPSVLLVEDDRLTRTVLRHDLKLCGFDVDIAENGDVALKKLQRICRSGTHGYDLVLTDVFMPKVDGEALVKAILNSDFRNIPVAVMSANCDEEAVNRLLSIGAAEYLLKPLRTSTLTRLRRLMSGQKQSTKQDHANSPESNRSALSMSLLQAARILSSDNPTTNSGSALTQQPPSSPQSSTPSPSPQEFSYTMLAPGNVQVYPNATASPSPTPAADKKVTQLVTGTDSAPAAPVNTQMVNVAVMLPVEVSNASGEKKCAAYLAASGIMTSLESRKAALARFRAKKARSHFAPKVRYHERKKLAEARPRYKGQFIKVAALPKSLQLAATATMAGSGSPGSAR